MGVQLLEVCVSQAHSRLGQGKLAAPHVQQGALVSATARMCLEYVDLAPTDPRQTLLNASLVQNEHFHLLVA